MATGGTPAAPVSPVPFEDVDDELLASQRPAPEGLDGDDHLADMVSSLPSKMEVNLPLKLRLYQRFWLAEIHVPAAVALQRRFVPCPDDVIVASLPKCGTTWLIALTFAAMARRVHPPAAAGHPLRRLNPHQCLPFLEGLFGRGLEAKLDALPSPRLMNTHMPLAMLPSIAAPPVATANSGDRGGCNKIVYVCREPKDMVVSMWHYTRQLMPAVSFAETLESYCDGAKIYGPFWDHILGYWRASAKMPDNVLFLRYEELLRDPAGNVRKLARFIGLPFSEAEEEAGIVEAIVELCSLDNMRGIEANKTGYVDAQRKIPRETLFRKGVVGDWASHMSPEIARRVDDIIADKFSGTGLTFK